MVAGECKLFRIIYLLGNVGAAVVTVEMATVSSTGKDRRVVTTHTHPG